MKFGEKSKHMPRRQMRSWEKGRGKKGRRGSEEVDGWGLKEKKGPPMETEGGDLRKG